MSWEVREGSSVRVSSRPGVRHAVRAVDLERGVLTVQPRDRRFRNCGPRREVPADEVVALDTGWRGDPGDVCWTPLAGRVEFPKMPGLFYAQGEGWPMPDGHREALAAMDAQP